MTRDEILQLFRQGLPSAEEAPSWEARVRASIQALPNADASECYRAWKLLLCGDDNISSTVEEKSPSGQYTLKITIHPPILPNRMSCSRGQIFGADGSLLATVCRNYGSFPFAWVEGHPKGDFLLCGEDYQGQTLVDLHTGVVRSKLSDNADKGWGFCWASIHPSPGMTRLAVNGCFWACPYETVFYDFSDPESMEWPKIGDSALDFKGWLDEDTCQVLRTWDVVDLPGHPLHGKSERQMSLADINECLQEGIRRGLTEDEDGWTEVEEVSTVHLNALTSEGAPTPA